MEIETKAVTENELFARKKQVAQLKKVALWDMVIIGGGATGLGVALEGAARGYRVLVLEQSDFAKSTSSKSTKLVHGGVRYLAQGDVFLVREASVERGLLSKNAPHLVRNLSFVIPVYKVFDKLKYTIGLKLYDWIAGKESIGSSLPISKKETMLKLPNIHTDGLVGGILYHDGQFDDSRLAVNLVQTIIEKGGSAINYIKVTGILKECGKVAGVIACDVESGQSFNIGAKSVVNATGVFVDEILRLDNPSAPKSVCVSQGVHLVLDKKFLPSDTALMIPKTPDGRVLFVVPWHNKLVVGTTDTPVAHISLEPVALEEEINFILDTAGRYLVIKPGRKDVLSVFAGLRPLAVPKEGGHKTKEISRSHKILISASGLFTIIGGKWTTYRKMGEDMLNYVEKNLSWKNRKTPTKHMPIHGYSESSKWDDPFYYYGSEAESIKKMMDENRQYYWLSDSLHIHQVQVIWAIHQEMARTVEDFLSRRTRALLLDAKESMRIARPVAELMAHELGEGENWIEKQVNDFKEVATPYILN
jgi:glycerol-3-phosphate dehydrogenase